MVPYHVPTGEGIASGEFSWLDFCSISSTCEYPREAYEALKFLTWGKEGFSARCDAYATLVNEAGNPTYRIPGAMLLTNDEEVVAKYRALFPADEAFWDGYFANMKYPVTFGGRAIPGFNTFITDYYHGSDYAGYTGIESAINAGVIDPYDYTDQLNASGRAAYDTAMTTFVQVYGAAE